MKTLIPIYIQPLPNQPYMDNWYIRAPLSFYYPVTKTDAEYPVCSVFSLSLAECWEKHVYSPADIPRSLNMLVEPK